ncbi:MAG TPA: hypothetical protein VHI52_17240, partial [Verrucomicrobiae bacterium]|nr:hypothetical protein [Verrucomicrobiae bacterium]
VYFEPGTCVLNGRTHATMTYLWFYPAEPGKSNPRRLSAQGVRLTLNSAGKPGIWEVLADPSRAEIIFVSQSVEAAALSQYGKPLPGRQFAVERGTGEHPNVVVARVIDDGPVAMGPILYLLAPSRGVSTLICRCMPAQARQIARTVGYDLVNSDLIAPLIGRASGAASLKNPTLPHFENSAEVLEKRLRLPDSF